MTLRGQFPLAEVLVAELFRKHGLSDGSVYKWRAKFSDLEFPYTKQLKALERENAKPERLFSSNILDQVWETYITCALTYEGWLHLTVVLVPHSPALVRCRAKPVLATERVIFTPYVRSQVQPAGAKN